MTAYLSLEDLVIIAAAVLARSESDVLDMINLNLADSALHAPQASFGEIEFYPEFPMKVAVLGTRIVRNHSLVDGNKRTALASMIEFAERNGYQWMDPEADGADGQETYDVMLRVAGDDPVEDIEPWLASWVAKRLRARG